MIFCVPGALVGAGNEAFGAAVLALYFGVYVPFRVPDALAIGGFCRESFFTVLKFSAAHKTIRRFPVSTDKLQGFKDISGCLSSIGRIASIASIGIPLLGFGRARVLNGGQSLLIAVPNKPGQARQHSQNQESRQQAFLWRRSLHFFGLWTFGLWTLDF